MTSAIDRKRINGPEISVIPLPLEDTEPLEAAPVLSTSGTRADSRAPEAVRPLFLRTGIIPQADGSAFVEQGNSKVICAVYGPRPDRKLADPDQGRLTVEFRFATFSQPKRRSFVKDVVEKEYSTLLHSALVPAVRLDSFPKASVDVHVTVLEDDGTLAAVAAGISAASLALADAGVEMYDVVTAASCGFIVDSGEGDGSSNGGSGEVIVMDLTRAEERHARGTMLLGYMPSVNQVTQIIQSGNVKGELAEEAMDYCIDAAAEVHTLMTECLTSAVTDGGMAAEDGMDVDA